MKAIQYFHFSPSKIFSFKGLPAKLLQCTIRNNKPVIMCQKQDGEFFWIDPQGKIKVKLFQNEITHENEI